MQYDPRLEEACRNCRFFHPYTYDFGEDSVEVETNYGECRRFPPKSAVSSDDCTPPTSDFPIVDCDLWCGEFDI